MPRRICALLGLLGALAAGGCAPARSVAQGMCEDVAHALAARDIACGTALIGEPGYADALGCASATSIRDPDALYDACIPAISTLPCDVVGPLPEACDAQIR